MEEKVLNKIREEYNQNIQILQEYNVIAKRVSELAQNELVKEYLELINALKKHDGKKINECSESNLINVSFGKAIHEIKETNNIYVYIGTYMLSRECDILHGTSDIKLGKDDPRAEYRIYRNIETGDSETIDISDSNKFEKSHKIIYPRTMLSDTFFYAIQNEFFSIAVNESQQTACDKILSEECQKNILHMIKEIV